MANIYEKIPKQLTLEAFEDIINSQHVKIERIVSKGNSSNWYDQTQDEWVLLLQGHAILAYENGEQLTLQAGDYLHIPAHTKHRVLWTTNETESIWLAIHYTADVSA